ncbi:SRPBCC family protein [Dactylosporangium sp. CS-033363]|uniref:SRPBCC family protein n=1 Tax=Dactylosporangium sp. CS-033363 TaxID=3239935 RepID=UPI003D8D6895
MLQTVQPIQRDIVVGVRPQRAFEVFTGDMTSWWPASHHIGSAPIAEVLIEPRVGGRWYTRHQDGTETSTGFVTVWEPPTRFVVTWQIGADWKYHDDLVTSIEVRFVEQPDGRTRVLLEHRGLEAFGTDAAKMRTTFEGPDAWTGILAAYAQVAAA